MYRYCTLILTKITAILRYAEKVPKIDYIYIYIYIYIERERERDPPKYKQLWDGVREL